MNFKEKAEWERLSSEIIRAVERGERSGQWGNVTALAVLMARVAAPGCAVRKAADGILSVIRSDKRARPWASALDLARMPIPKATDGDGEDDSVEI